MSNLPPLPIPITARLLELIHNPAFKHQRHTPISKREFLNMRSSINTHIRMYGDRLFRLVRQLLYRSHAPVYQSTPETAPAYSGEITYWDH